MWRYSNVMFTLMMHWRVFVYRYKLLHVFYIHFHLNIEYSKLANFIEETITPSERWFVYLHNVRMEIENELLISCEIPRDLVGFLKIMPSDITVTSHKLHGGPNHRLVDCLFNSLHRLTSKKMPKLRHWSFVRWVHWWPLDARHKGQ